MVSLTWRVSELCNMHITQSPLPLFLFFLYLLRPCPLLLLILHNFFLSFCLHSLHAHTSQLLSNIVHKTSYTTQHSTALQCITLDYILLYSSHVRVTNHPIISFSLLSLNLHLHLYSTLLYSTLLYSTLLYSTLLYSTLLYFFQIQFGVY